MIAHKPKKSLSRPGGIAPAGMTNLTRLNDLKNDLLDNPMMKLEERITRDSDTQISEVWHRNNKKAPDQIGTLHEYKTENSVCEPVKIVSICKNYFLEPLQKENSCGT